MTNTLKTFEVELKRVSYITVKVEAESKDHAEELAWTELMTDGAWNVEDANWDVETITETE